jgi:hypothetical protein
VLSTVPQEGSRRPAPTRVAWSHQHQCLRNPSRHGSRFDPATGEALDGPTRSALPYARITVRGDVIFHPVTYEQMGCQRCAASSGAQLAGSRGELRPGMWCSSSPLVGVASFTAWR